MFYPFNFGHTLKSPPVNNLSNDQSIQANGFPIDYNGFIQLPLVSRYKASGETLNQIKFRITKSICSLFKNPDVIVRVLNYQGQRYSVQGSVRKGGQFYLNDQPINLYTALGMAGGVSELGDNTYIQLVRKWYYV